MKNLQLSTLLLSSLLFFSGCADNKNEAEKPTSTTTKTTTDSLKEQPKVVADAATILARKQVPVLCYHQIRNWRAGDSKSAKDIIVPVDLFRSHMKILKDSGYQTILPDQLYEYLAYGTPLPPKPVMLTFDDTDIDQYTEAWPIMKEYGFKGVFFVMTVSINRRPRYMTTEEIKELSDEGNVIASHTWNHERVPSYTTDEQWATQIEGPKKKIEEITGKPAEYFAYPFGLWDRKAIPELKKRGVKAAFILSTKRDPDDPLYTIRRIIGSGYWSAQGLYSSMIKTFEDGK